MKTTKRFLGLFGFVTAGLLLSQTTFGKNGGTSILHWMLRATFTNTDVAPNAVGSVDAKLNQQGNADNQKLNISLGKLDSNTTYTLSAAVGDDTNLTDVTTFTTDANGAAAFKYSHVGSSNGNGHGPGTPLPDVLKPISNIRQLVIGISSTQDVLRADLAASDSFQYLVKRAMSNDHVENTAAAALRIHASGSFVQFRIDASGLIATQTYFLAINSNIAADFTSDTNGKLTINGLPAGAPSVLDIHDLALLNSVSNGVLSTTLP